MSWNNRIFIASLFLVSVGCKVELTGISVTEEATPPSPPAQIHVEKQFVIELTMDELIKHDGQVISREQLQHLIINLPDRSKTNFLLTGSGELPLARITELQRFIMESVPDIDAVYFRTTE